jgi:bifunctional non-homologous end joining protein LigD
MHPKTARYHLGRHTVELSRPDKLLFPRTGLTKADLADYYHQVAETILPYLRDRPVSMHRFPDGIEGEDFYHKEVPGYFPGWIRRASVTVKEEDGHQSQVVIENAATLIYLADQACITPHVWLSRIDRIGYPDRMIFDLDPPVEDFEIVRQGAWTLRRLLDELGLPAFVMMTGSRGLHVTVPLDRGADFETVHAFARGVAELLADRQPDALTVELHKNKRRGRLFLDYLRNAYAQTAVPPYAVRARSGAPVATPLDWQELSNGGLTARSYTVGNIFRRLGKKGDPWKGMGRHARSLKEPRRLLKELVNQETKSERRHTIS